MARSFSSAKTVSAFIANKISAVGRGYATSSSGGGAVSSSVRSGAPTNILLKKKVSSNNESANKSWGPDPITGYYRPENQAKEIDAAELREMLVNNKTRRNQLN